MKGFKMDILKIILRHYPTIKDCARDLNISDVAIHHWQRRGQVPPRRALEIEEKSKGKIKRTKLCPEIFQ